MNNRMWYAVLAKNAVCVICWTILAIYFNKWWIALFAAFFLSGVQTAYKRYRICDGCGKHSPYADSYNEALDMAKKAGWIHFVDSNRDYCPECQREFEKN